MKNWITKQVKWLLVLCFFLQVIGVGTVVWRYFVTKSNGQIYRFQTQPIDPRDPFRGQYVALNFTANDFYPFKKCNTTGYVQETRKLFAMLETDEAEFARITKVTNEKPKGRNYLIVYGKYCGYRDNKGKIRVTLPFNRFYANEFEALAIEKQARNNPETTYLNVWVDSGAYAVGNLVLGETND